MTQRNAIQEAIKYLEMAVDTFPDKDDEIREYNDTLYKMIEKLESYLLP